MKNLSLLFVAIFAISCNSQQQPANQEASASAATEIRLEGNDQLQFNLSEIKVEAGAKVKLTLAHVGQLGKDVMGHNFVLLKKDTDVADFAMRASTAKENGYIPDGDEIIVNTELIGGGEEVTIEFDAPEAGTYDFLCSFAGHFAVMKGKFIVE